MKTFQNAIACAAVIALAATTSVRAAEEGQKEGKATIRAMHGDVQYMENGGWAPAHVNQKLASGATIKTGATGTADLSVNGTASAVRMTNNTTLKIPKMLYTGSVREGDTWTMLNLETGSVLGNVKKISANSRYEIETPHGVAGIRGTDFRVEAIPTPDGKFTVRFDSITGVITVSAIINGQPVTHTLTTGTSWEIGESPKQMKAEIIQDYQSQIMSLVTAMENGGGNNGPGPGRGGPPSGPVNPPIPQPFPGGNPQGPPAQPAS